MLTIKKTSPAPFHNANRLNGSKASALYGVFMGYKQIGFVSRNVCHGWMAYNLDHRPVCPRAFVKMAELRAWLASQPALEAFGVSASQAQQAQAIDNASGVVLFEGPSAFDGKPIVVIAIIKSDNVKTGNMIQTYILRSDLDPLESVKAGQDVSICWDCPHRGDGTGKGRSCYVNLGQGPLVVFRSYKAGKYPKISPAHPAWRAIVSGRIVRAGTYGDPTALPVGFWQALLSGAAGWTGYTHQWRLKAEFQGLLMASADSPAQAQQAQGQGWRTFRVRSKAQALLAGEIICPASEEAGKRVNCDSCQLCQGTAKRARNIAIIAHGGRPVLANAQRTIEAQALA